MDKETAEQILQALEQDEQDTQDKMQRVQGQKRRVEKEWQFRLKTRVQRLEIKEYETFVDDLIEKMNYRNLYNKIANKLKDQSGSSSSLKSISDFISSVYFLLLYIIGYTYASNLEL